MWFRSASLHFPLPFLLLFLLLLLLTKGAPCLNVNAAVNEDVDALRRLCDNLKHERFNVVYDEYGWSLETVPGIDGPTDNNDTSVDHIQGFCVDIFKEFVRICKIDYRLYRNDDGFWGKYNETRKAWDGMVGKLVNGKADMALTYYYIQPHLVGVVDFSRPFLSSGIGIVMKNRAKAETSLGGLNFILNSFTFGGWMMIIGVLMVGIIAVILIQKLLPATTAYIKHDRAISLAYSPPSSPSPMPLSLSWPSTSPPSAPSPPSILGKYTQRILWFMGYATFGFDDVNRALYNNPLRLMAFFWIIYAWLIFTMLSSQLTSNLTVAKFPRRVENFRDLLSEPGLTYFFDGADTQLKKNLELHTAPFAQRIKMKYDSFGPEHARKFLPTNPTKYLDSEDILEYTANGDAALLAEGIDVPVVMKNAFAFQCDIYMAMDYTIKVDPAFAFRKALNERDKASLLRRAFDLYLSIIIRTGDLDLILSRWHIPYLGYQEEECRLSALDNGDTAINAKDLTTFTLLAISGIALSVLVAALHRIREYYSTTATTAENHANDVFL